MSGIPPSGPYSSSPYGPAFADLKNVIQPRFNILDAFIDPNGIPSFIIAPENTEEKFTAIVEDFSKMNLLATLRHDGDRLLIKVFTKPVARASRFRLNVVLLGATLATIFYAGYAGFLNSPILREVLQKDENPFLQAGLFMACLFGIIGLHELGHLLACRKHNLDSSLPYFIPGPPPIGTFGAVVSLRSPPINRNQLFDMGFAGPLAGFVATVIITLVSFQLAFQVPIQQANLWEQQGLIQQAFWPNYPLLFDVIQPVVRPAVEGYSLILTQLELAAWVGAFLTFLNILPVWQLDGGHISRAVFGERGRKIASAVGMILLFAANWFFAIFILFWMLSTRRGTVGAEPLDDVSPLSRSRKLMFLLILAITVLCFVSLYDFTSMIG